MMTNVFTVFRKYLVDGLTANVERMKAYVDGSVGVITAINQHVGYETAARIAREAIDTGKPVRDLILRDKILTREQLDAILDPFEMTSFGIAGSKQPQQEHVWNQALCQFQCFCAVIGFCNNVNIRCLI